MGFCAIIVAIRMNLFRNETEVPMESLKIYRKRLIPSENIWLKDDVVLLCNEEYIVTRWKTLKPR